MNDPSRPPVSVVVPFYNTADYLDACVRSVLDQDYPNYEVVLSDNVSTDGSSEIARRHAETDRRVRYVAHDEFVGQVRNYNRALTEASPDCRYVKIVQADDWIYPECLAKLVDVAKRHPEVGLVSSFYLDGARVRNVGLPPEREVFTGREVCRRQLLEGQFFLGTPTTVLYRAEVVRERDPFYSVGSLHEDTEAGYEILRDWDLGFVHQVLSFARVRDESISASGEEHDPHLLDKLIAIHRYGGDYLSPDEHRRVWKKYARRYHTFLGESLLRGRGEDFWAYHREGLSTIDRPLRRLRVGLGALRAAASLLLNPLDTAERLMRRVTRRLRPPLRAEEEAPGGDGRREAGAGARAPGGQVREEAAS